MNKVDSITFYILMGIGVFLVGFGFAEILFLVFYKR